MINQPDNWIILKILKEDVEGHYYKVLAGWSGGYLDGDSWRMNSGIDKIEQTDTYYNFIGYSGSVYRCTKQSEMVRMNIGGVLQQLMKQYPDNVTVVNVEDILEEFSK